MNPTNDYSYGYGVQDNLSRWNTDSPDSGSSCGCDEAPPISVDPSSGVISVGKFEIHVSKNTVRVKDTESGQWVEAWGDPHFKTSDGDKAQFHTENLTIDLPGGIKVTIVPTEKVGDKPTFVDQVAVMTADESTVVTGIHSDAGPQFGSVLDSSGATDAMHEDGTVLYMKDNLDDLFFAGDDAELIGEDKTQRWNEHMLDGKGGESMYDFIRFELLGELDSEFQSDLTDALDTSEYAGLDVYSMLFMIMEKVANQTSEAVEKLAQLQDLKAVQQDRQRQLDQVNQEVDSLEGRIEGLEVRLENATGREAEEIKAELGELNQELDTAETKQGALEEQLSQPEMQNLDGQITRLTGEVQRLEQYRQQINTMMSNLTKSEHEMNMVTLRNIPTR